MYRHHIAPPRAFSQFSHDIIRHPRLSSDAVRLLTWQLSLPQGARESLSRTAERARIGATAFNRAKRQLKEEGFVHERRVQGPGGLWVTQQLVSNVPLSAGEAAKLLGRTPIGTTGTTGPVQAAPAPQPAPAPAPAPTSAPEASSPPVAPSAPNPAVGAPTRWSTDGHPKKDPGENTSHRPSGPRTIVTEQARAFVAALPRLSADLRRIPRGMHDELTQLTARWLAAGHSPAAIRTHILRGLPDDGAPVHRPGGLVRYLLREVPPLEERSAPVPVPVPDLSLPAAPRLSARLTGTRECAGDHVQPRLFRPADDEWFCAECRPYACEE
ncbi:hypothetical protein [Streptomyces sp. NPDC021356]|uniref:hypothetical protein n=1 Tax=Streptomyces sp. NPDC021356 TaxID=3154900 RepID=UPI0033E6794A